MEDEEWEVEAVCGEGCIHGLDGLMTGGLWRIDMTLWPMPYVSEIELDVHILYPDLE